MNSDMCKDRRWTGDIIHQISGWAANHQCRHVGVVGEERAGKSTRSEPTAQNRDLGGSIRERELHRRDIVADRDNRYHGDDGRAKG